MSVRVCPHCRFLAKTISEAENHQCPTDEVLFNRNVSIYDATVVNTDKIFGDDEENGEVAM